MYSLRAGNVLHSKRLTSAQSIKLFYSFILFIINKLSLKNLLFYNTLTSKIITLLVALYTVVNFLH